MENHISIANSVKDVRLVPSKSKKTGVEYDRLEIEFMDGYKFGVPVFGDTDYILRKQADYESDDEL